MLFLLYLCILYVVHVVRECCQCTLGEGKNEESMNMGVSHWHWNVEKIQKEIQAFEAPIWQSLWIFKNLCFIVELLRIPQFVALNKNRPRFPGVRIVFLLRLQWASRHHCYTSCPCCCGYHFSVGLTNIGGGGSLLGGVKVDDSRWRAAARDILFAASNWIDLERSIWGKVSMWARNGEPELSWLVSSVIAMLNNN